MRAPDGIRTMRDWSVEFERHRLGWWFLALALGVVVWAFVSGFVGTFVLGLFIYYGSRPVHHWLLKRLDSRGAAATLTMLLIVVPALLLLSYVGLVAIREFTAVAGGDLIQQLSQRIPGSASRALQDPWGYLSRLDNVDTLLGQLSGGIQTFQFVSTGLVHLTLAMTFAFFCLRDGHRVGRWFRGDIADRGSVAYAYLAAVDADLETVYFGNVVTVLLVTVLSVGVYNGYNLFAPAAVDLPFPTLLALLTGLATFVPLVVGKVVYLPATAFLAISAVRADAGLLWAVGFFLTAFVVLDLFPLTVLRPVISGRKLHSGMVLFAYILGAAYFGWYGLFLGPLLLVVVVQFAKLVFPELLHGERLTARPSSVLQLGHDPPTDGGETGDGASAEEESGDSDDEGDTADGDGTGVSSGAS
jgi:predicted PurR-regulated permease PerM